MSVYLLHQTLTETVARVPDKPAVIERDRAITYAQLLRNARSLSRTLSSRGVSPGDLVGLYLPKSLESIIALFGVLMCGGVYVPIDPKAPKSRIRSILNSCNIRILIASNALLNRSFSGEGDLDDFDCLVVTGEPGPGESDRATPTTVPWLEALNNEPADADVWNGSDSSPAYILHTSGSTGDPKGVVISHLNALTFVRSAVSHFGLDPSDRFGCHAPLHFDLTVFDIYSCLSVGATLVLVPDNLAVFPLKLTEFIQAKRITVWNSVASVLALIADKGCGAGVRFRDLRLVIFSGEVLQVKYLSKLRKHMSKATFCNIYGQTEANSSTCYMVGRIPDVSRWAVPVGQPLSNYEIFLLDGEGREVRETGREGEIFVKSGAVALGYFRNPELTAEKFLDDPRFPSPAGRVYRTGDLGTYDANGDLVFSGRMDNMVKVRGHRVELGEIEQCLCTHENVQLAVVVAVPDEKFTNRLFCFLSCRDGENIDTADLTVFCSGFLPPYMLPERIWITDRFPHTPNDKIDRERVRGMVQEELSTETGKGA